MLHEPCRGLLRFGTVACTTSLPVLHSLISLFFFFKPFCARYHYRGFTGRDGGYGYGQVRKSGVEFWRCMCSDTRVFRRPFYGNRQVWTLCDQGWVPSGGRREGFVSLLMLGAVVGAHCRQCWPPNCFCAFGSRLSDVQCIEEPPDDHLENDPCIKRKNMLTQSSIPSMIVNGLPNVLPERSTVDVVTISTCCKICSLL